MENHNSYFLLMFLKKHWEKMVYVFTMFFSWDRRSQDGFPTVWRGYIITHNEIKIRNCQHEIFNQSILSRTVVTYIPIQYSAMLLGMLDKN